MNDWTAHQQHDESMRMLRAQEIIDASAVRPLTEEERIEIAVEVGLGTMYRKQLAKD